MTAALFRAVLRAGAIVFAATTATRASARPAPDACALLSSREIASVQGESVRRAKESRLPSTRFEVSQCFYELPTFAKSVSLEVTRARAGEPRTPRDGWREMFDRRREPKREEEEEREERKTSEPRRVTGVGEDAYWLGNAVGGALYVLRKDSWFRLSVGGPETEAVKIEKLKKLARRAANRL